MRVHLFAILILPALLACGGAGGEAPRPEAAPAVDTAAEEAALMAADRAFLQAVQESRAAGWTASFAPDGIQVPGGSEVAWGTDAVRHLAEQLFADPSFTLTWEPVHARVAASGDLGFTVGNYVAEGKTPAGEPLRQEGNYVTVWRKQPDGSWKVAVDIGNPGPPTRKPAGW